MQSKAKNQPSKRSCTQISPRGKKKRGAPRILAPDRQTRSRRISPRIDFCPIRFAAPLSSVLIPLSFYYIYTRARLRFASKLGECNRQDNKQFGFLLLLRETAMAATAPSPAISAPTKPAGDRKVEQEQMHVLAVDDSNVDRAVIAKILRGSKYRGAPPLFDHARSAAYYHA
jgi:hypothetical protein